MLGEIKFNKETIESVDNLLDQLIEQIEDYKTSHQSGVVSCDEIVALLEARKSTIGKKAFLVYSVTVTGGEHPECIATNEDIAKDMVNDLVNKTNLINADYKILPCDHLVIDNKIFFY